MGKAAIEDAHCAPRHLGGRAFEIGFVLLGCDKLGSGSVQDSGSQTADRPAAGMLCMPSMLWSSAQMLHRSHLSPEYDRARETMVPVAFRPIANSSRAPSPLLVSAMISSAMVPKPQDPTR